MTTSYAPTVNPGDVRRRVKEIRLGTPLAQVISVIIYEEDVIRLADGTEAPLRDQGVIATIINPTDAAQLMAVFALRNYADDNLLGADMNVGTVLTAFFSWVRSQQIARDWVHDNPPVVPEPPADPPVDPPVEDPEPVVDP
jgi:hypothetical protein